MRYFLRRFYHNHSGATAIEYALLAALISIVSIVAIGNIGSILTDGAEYIADELSFANR